MFIDQHGKGDYFFFLLCSSMILNVSPPKPASPILPALVTSAGLYGPTATINPERTVSQLSDAVFLSQAIGMFFEIFFCGTSLIMAVIYYWSRVHPGAQGEVSFMFGLKFQGDSHTQHKSRVPSRYLL